MEFIEEEAGARDKVQIIALNTKIWFFLFKKLFLSNLGPTPLDFALFDTWGCRRV